MKSKVFFLSLSMLSVGLFVLGCGGSAPSVDLGDCSLGNLLWGVSHYGFTEKDPDEALAYADKALELYGDEARQMQASLSDFPATDPAEATYKYRVLNNVGLVVLSKGEILMEKGDRTGCA